MKLPNNLRKKRGFLELKYGKYWVAWNPYHSKLAAYVLGKGNHWPFAKESTVLYLGAAEGNTVSFLSKICIEGRIVGVDISPTAMAELIVLAEKEKNIIPFLGDAHFPRTYQPHANIPDILYQDIAQRDQLDVFIRNYLFFKPKCGFLMIKSRSMPGKDEDIFDTVENKLKTEFNNVEIIDIRKWAKGHKAYYVQ
jgi:fibrillarin-like pre-rRNA processing protein